MANKTDLVNEVQALLATKDFNISKKETDTIVNSVLDIIIRLTGESGKLQLIGFGTFSVKERAARKGRNPQTGEEIEIAAKRVPSFKSGKDFNKFVL